MQEGNEQKNRLSVKDLIGLTFSAIALTISASSYYVGNLRINNNMLARITNAGVTAVQPNDHENGYANGQIFLTVAFINAGNRPAIVTGATYQLSDIPNLDNGGFGDKVLVDPGTFPILIAPKDLRLVNLKIPIQFVLHSYDSGAKLPPSNEVEDSDLRQFFGGIRYDAVDSDGILHSTWSGMQFSMVVTKTRWSRLGGFGTFSLTQIF